MVFSSPLFLFAFLPAVIGLYFLCPRAARNAFLLCASILFYLVGSGVYTLLLVGSIAANYAIAGSMPAAPSTRRRVLLALCLGVNLVPLAVFKYAGFAVAALNQALRPLGLTPWPVPDLFLPAGISFFAFQGVAYAVDVYRGQIAAARSLTEYALFKAFFPQLIAGPIPRYGEMAAALRARRHSLEQTADGLVRFGFGLGKKVLLADTLGRIADSVFADGGAAASTATAWLGLVCYTLQIFFDFSGYSDMAVGLGTVFGLPLPENFRQPYRATSLTDFWRRWHITLSTWFRDYLYIPLGGNRRGAARTLVHLIAVAVVCGLWHGAAYTYMAWGLYHGMLLAIERVLRTRWNIALPAGHGARAFTLFLVMIGWVLFRAESLPEAFTYLKVLFGLAGDPDPLFPLRYYLTSNHALVLAVAALIALWPDAPPRLSVSRYVRPLAALAVAAQALIAQAPQTFNPFIYFQF